MLERFYKPLGLAGEMTMTDVKKEFLRGARCTVPLFIGLVPFALVLGVAANEAGLNAAQGTFFSLSMLAGTAQLAAVQLYGAGASAAIILFTAIVVNLRYSMYSLSLFQILGEKTFLERLLAAFFLSDQSYVITMAERENSDDNPFLPAFFFGSSLAVYTVWVSGIFLGFSLKAIIPAGLSLDFAIPLVFMFFLIPPQGQGQAVFGPCRSRFLGRAGPTTSASVGSSGLDPDRYRLRYGSRSFYQGEGERGGR
ncbi:MAG: AzlC family ABC transporter permease [Synergistaceae bacterium]|nr:AzlC family ABC transporter permease [Synergistaceae bacterium]